MNQEEIVLTPSRTTRFKRDYKREIKGNSKKMLENRFPEILNILCNNGQLPESYEDHPLKGEWYGFRDLHIAPDLILIYRKTDTVLELAALGSHSELF